MLWSPNSRSYRPLTQVLSILNRPIKTKNRYIPCFAVKAMCTSNIIFIPIKISVIPIKISMYINTDFGVQINVNNLKNKYDT